MTLRIPKLSKRLLSLVLACSVLVACGTGTSETEQLRAELEELRQQIESGNEPTDGAETAESTTTVAADPGATWDQAVARWSAQQPMHDGVAPPTPVDGIPVAAVSTPTQTTIWRWDGTAWQLSQEIRHSGDPVSHVIETLLRDLSGDGNPELIIHYAVRPYTSIEVYTPVFDNFLQVEFDSSGLDRDVFAPPSWRIDGDALVFEFNYDLESSYRWSDGRLVAGPVRCQRYNEYFGSVFSDMMLCDKGSSVREVQVALQNGGFNPGQVDGYFGPSTEAAVKRFQRSFGWEEDGQLSLTGVNFLLEQYG